ncbi:helix-turn-helix domain-containing protein [Streptomyces sp. NPDC012637]|uniref:helix-turn-helix domain-containing protein n=1 Tax=Streptomyces sp. NPDC012637 TaxID=3364842 RepID=UPI0036E7A0D9
MQAVSTRPVGSSYRGAPGRAAREGRVPGDPLWSSAHVSQLVAQRRPGALIRLGRERRGWTLADLGGHLGCSAATVARLERLRQVTDLTLIHRVAARVGVPANVLVSSLAPLESTGPSAARAAASPHAEEDPMRRRSLLTATATAPAVLLLSVDRALADTPAPHQPRRLRHPRGRRPRAVRHRCPPPAPRPAPPRTDRRRARRRDLAPRARAGTPVLRLQPGHGPAGQARRLRAGPSHRRPCRHLGGGLRLTARLRSGLPGARHRAAPPGPQRRSPAAHGDGSGARGGDRTAHRRGHLRVRADAAHPGLPRCPRGTAGRGPGHGRGSPPGRLFPISPAAVDLYTVGVPGHSATPARPSKRISTCGRSSSPPPSTRRASGPTWHAPGGRGDGPSRPPAPCSTLTEPAPERSAAAPPSGASSPNSPNGTRVPLASASCTPACRPLGTESRRVPGHRALLLSSSSVSPCPSLVGERRRVRLRGTA